MSHIPSFTVFVACIGRPTLQRTIDSFLRQERHPDDVLVLVMNPDEAPEGVAFAYQHSTDRIHVYLCQERGYFNKMNWASFNVPVNTTHILPMLGDDDIFVKGAFTQLREACAEDLERIVLFQFLSPMRFTLWDEPRMKMNHISGHCIAVPQRYWPAPFSTRDYLTVDYDWMLGLLARQRVERGIEPLWLEKLLIVARPDASTDAKGLL